MSDFYTILTDIGMHKIMQAYSGDKKILITQMAFGDSNGEYYTPNSMQTHLQNEVYRTQIKNRFIDSSNNLVTDAIIPVEVGGFSIREVGIFDSENDMIAIAKHPETYKPDTNQGSAKELTIKMITGISESSVIDIDVDPTIIFATMKDLDRVEKKINKNTDDILFLKENTNIINGEIRNSISRISHPTIDAVVKGPLQMEFSHNVDNGENFENIKLYEEENPDVNVLTDKQIDIDSRVLKLIYPDLTPNKKYISEIPLKALKDRFGNPIKGIFTYSFLVRSMIQENGGIIDFTGRYIRDEGIELNWKNPVNVGLVGVKLMKSSIDIPTGIDDENSTLLQDNDLETYFDADVIEEGIYYYKLFPYDEVGNINIDATNELTIEAIQRDMIFITPDASVEDINYAISEASDNNEIIFTEGEFLFDNPIEIRRSNITLKGQYTLTTLKCNFVDNLRGVIDVRGTKEDKLSGIEINNLVVDGNKDNDKQSRGIYVEHIGIISENRGIDSVIKDGIKILNCVVQNNNSTGVWLATSSNNNTITGNTIQNNNSTGIYLINSSNNNTITGNTVQNNNSHGIHLSSSSNNAITGNTVLNNNHHGIYLVSSSNNNTITGNTIQNNNSTGIYLINSSNNTITGNTVLNNNHHGIYLVSSSNNNTITGNISQVNIRGVWINGVDCTNNMVLSNILRLNTTANYTDTGTGTLKYGNQELTS